MTDDRSFERRLAAWLEEEAVGSLPDRVFDDAFARTRVARRPARPFAGRFPNMPRFAVSLIAVGAAAIVLVFGIALVRQPSDRIGATPGPLASAATPPSASVPAGAKVDRIQVGVPAGPRWFASDGQSLWVHEPTSLVRVDLASSTVVGQVSLPQMDYGYVATGEGFVWQTDYQNNVLVKVDPVAEKAIKSIPVGPAPAGVAVTAGSVWVADEHGGAVERIDPATNRVIATIPVGPVGDSGPQIMTVGPGGVWVDIQNSGSVVQVLAATNSAGLQVPHEGGLASDGQQVWIEGADGQPRVIQIDPVSGKVITTVALDTGAGNMAIGLGYVWVGAGPGIEQIDPATGTVVQKVSLLNAGGSVDGGNMLVAGGSIWVTADGEPYVVRVTPR